MGKNTLDFHFWKPDHVTFLTSVLSSIGYYVALLLLPKQIQMLQCLKERLHCENVDNLRWGSTYLEPGACHCVSYDLCCYIYLLCT